MKKCKHKFQPRYNEVYTTIAEEFAKLPGPIELSGGSSAIPYLKEKTYVYDICIKCGEIQRPN